MPQVKRNALEQQCRQRPQQMFTKLRIYVEFYMCFTLPPILKGSFHLL